MADEDPSLVVGVLGPLEIHGRHAITVPSSPLERALLAILAIRGGRSMAIEALAYELWGDELPTSWRKNIHVRVSRIRAGLAAQGLNEFVLSADGGYRLAIDADQLDANRFDRWAAEGQRLLADGDPRAAIDVLSRALSLWRGDPLPELSHTSRGRGEAVRLAEEREAAIEASHDASLALGRHVEVVAALEAEVRRQPLREHRWEQLMLALYRSGRQAEALRAYQRARAVLIEELGVEPGPALRELESAIIEQSSELAEATAFEPSPTHGPIVVQSHAGADILEPSLAWARRQAETPLVGRREELALLDQVWAKVQQEGGGSVVLSGPPGLGKSRLAAEFALDVARRGAMVVALRCVAERGLTVLSERPLAPAGRRRPGEDVETGATLEHLLDVHQALVAEAQERPMLVFLEDMHAVDAVTSSLLLGLVDRPLPWGPTLPMLVLVALRQAPDRAPGSVDLMGALQRVRVSAHLPLEPLAPTEASELFEELLGADPGVSDLIDDAGGIPGHIVELARHARQSGVLDADGRWRTPAEAVGLGAIGIPEALRVSLNQRLDDLPREVAQFIAGVAIAEEPFTTETAAVIGATDRVTAWDLIEEAVDAGLIVAVPGSSDTFRFGAAVDRLAAAQRLSAARRIEVEGRLQAYEDGTFRLRAVGEDPDGG